MSQTFGDSTTPDSEGKIPLHIFATSDGHGGFAAQMVDYDPLLDRGEKYSLRLFNLKEAAPFLISGEVCLCRVDNVTVTSKFVAGRKKIYIDVVPLRRHVELTRSYSAELGGVIERRRSGTRLLSEALMECHSPSVPDAA